MAKNANLPYSREFNKNIYTPINNENIKYNNKESYNERRKLFELEYKKLLIKKITKGDEKPISIEGDKIIIREYKNK